MQTNVPGTRPKRKLCLRQPVYFIVAEGGNIKYAVSPRVPEADPKNYASQHYFRFWRLYDSESKWQQLGTTGESAVRNEFENGYYKVIPKEVPGVRNHPLYGT